jgi:hypothetical protein
MSFSMSLTSDKDSVNLGEIITVTYYCDGAYDTTIQSDNMVNPLDLGGPGEISGTMKFMPTQSGTFNVTLTAYGVVHQNKGIDNMSNVEMNYASVAVTVN